MLESSVATETSVTFPSLARARTRVQARPITLLISDDSLMGCQLLGNRLVRSSLNCKIVACAVSRAQISDAIRAEHVDVALISENLEDGPFVGFRIAKDLRVSHPKTKVVMLLKKAPDELVVDAFRSGAKGVFCRSGTWQNLRKCVQIVYEGQVWINSQQLHCVLDALATISPLRLVNVQGRRLLTKREEDVAKVVVEGFSNRDVARKLDLREHTVSNYLFRIYEKLGISSRVELVLYYLKQG